MCYFANMTSDLVTHTSYAAFESDWYTYPMDIQKFIILIVRRAQNPVKFKGLNVIDCTVETYGKVWELSILNVNFIVKCVYDGAVCQDIPFYYIDFGCEILSDQ